MRKLVKIFNEHGIRGSFNAEVMQQLTYRSQQERFPELRAIADEWEEVVMESFRQGHDIQLHLHPQWMGDSYEGRGNWKLGGDCSILKYLPQQIQRCSSLVNRGPLQDRPGACGVCHFAQDRGVFPDSDVILSELGFVFESIVAGSQEYTPQVKLDYTHCEERFVPNIDERCAQGCVRSNQSCAYRRTAFRGRATLYSGAILARRTRRCCEESAAGEMETGQRPRRYPADTAATNGRTKASPAPSGC
jgi:hypothetical protein